MTQKFYLRDSAANPSFPTSGEKSTTEPVGTQTYGLTPTDKDLLGAKGTTATSQATTLPNSTTTNNGTLGRWSSAPLAAGTYGAGTWTIAIQTAESDANYNVFWRSASIYFWRPSTNAVVGFVIDSNTQTGVEFGNAVANARYGQVITWVGSDVTIQDGDILVFEAWTGGTPSMAGNGKTATIYYDGTTDVTAAYSGTDPASYINAPADIPLAPASLNRTASDTLLGSDSVGSALTFARTASDTLLGSDTADRSLLLTRPAPTDVLLGTDSADRAPFLGNAAVSDTLLGTDSAEKQGVFFRAAGGSVPSLPSMSLAADWNGDLGVTATSHEVSAWVDQINGYTMGQSNAGQFPRDDVDSLNSHVGITFDGGNDYLTTSDAGALDLFRNRTGMTVYAVAMNRAGASGIGHRLFEWSEGTSTNRTRAGGFSARIGVTDNWGGGARRLDADAFAQFARSDGVFQDTAKAFCWVWDYANAIAALYDAAGNDGGSTVNPWQTAGSTSNTASLLAQFGAQGSPLIAQTEYFQGPLFRLLVYTVSHDSTQRTAVMSYIGATYFGTGGGESLLGGDVAAGIALPGRNATDALLGSDSADRGLLTFARTASDALLDVDAVTSAISAARTASDALLGTDVAAVSGLNRTATDDLLGTDSATRSLALARAATDLLLGADSAVGIGGSARTTSDTLLGADSAAKLQTFARTASDVLLGADAAVRAVLVARTASDTLLGGDSAARAVQAFTRVTADVLLGGDTAEGVVSGAQLRFASDTLLGADAASRVWAGQFTASDALLGVDSATRSVARARMTSDALLGADAAVLAAIFARGISDQLLGADAAVRTLTRVRAITDVLLGPDAAAVTAFAFFRVCADVLLGDDVATVTALITKHNVEFLTDAPETRIKLGMLQLKWQIDVMVEKWQSALVQVRDIADKPRVKQQTGLLTK